MPSTTSPAPSSGQPLAVSPRTWAAAAAATVLAWYALPDLVRSRGLRGVVKTGLLAVTAVGAAAVPDTWDCAGKVPEQVEAAVADLPKPAVAAIAVAGAVGATALTVWFEKAVYARGERKRAEGARFAHTVPAVVMAAATAAVALADWSRWCTPARRP